MDGGGGGVVGDRRRELSWRINLEELQLPDGASENRHTSFNIRRLIPTKKRKVVEYYKRQKRLLEGYNEMETIHVAGGLPAALTEAELKQVAKNERLAIHISNCANLILFMAKVYASNASRSLAVIASTMDSFS